MPSHTLARVGVARTFQTTQLFGSLTILENVLLAETAGKLGGIVSALHNDAKERFARSLLRFVGVDGDLDRRAELAAAWREAAGRDRPCARVAAENPAARRAGGGSLEGRQTAADRCCFAASPDLGIAVIIVEHDMPMIMSLSDLIVVLDGGKRIATGDAAAIRNDPLVRKAYLGDAPAGERQPCTAPGTRGHGARDQRARCLLRLVAGARRRSTSRSRQARRLPCSVPTARARPR